MNFLSSLWPYLNTFLLIFIIYLILYKDKNK